MLAAQLDDPYLLREFHTWLGFWQARAEALALRPDDHLREHARYEFLAAQSALQLFEERWRTEHRRCCARSSRTASWSCSVAQRRTPSSLS